eukprot:s2993_g7.t1
MASGLAGKVRRSTESDEFDLSGYDQARCNELAKASFSEPFPLKEMVRISFVVGGGKLVRQRFGPKCSVPKYSDDLPKFMVLRTAIPPRRVFQELGMNLARCSLYGTFTIIYLQNLGEVWTVLG